MASFAQLLESAGFRVRRNRADCAHCDGHMRLTVAFDEAKGVAHCHRCKWSTNKWKLARSQGVFIAPHKPGLAKLRVRKFRAWLAATSITMADRERHLARRAIWAEAALAYFPDMESAWTALASWYNERHAFECFWRACTDNIGRKQLYLMWRTYAEDSAT